MYFQSLLYAFLFYTNLIKNAINYLDRMDRTCFLHPPTNGLDVLNGLRRRRDVIQLNIKVSPRHSQTPNSIPL